MLNQQKQTPQASLAATAGAQANANQQRNAIAAPSRPQTPAKPSLRPPASFKPAPKPLPPAESVAPFNEEGVKLMPAPHAGGDASVQADSAELENLETQRESCGSEPIVRTQEALATPSLPGVDLASLTLNQNFQQMAGLKKTVSPVPMMKPGRQTWFTVCPDGKGSRQMAVVEDKESHQFYILDPTLCDELAGEWSLRLVVLCQTRNGSNFLWPLKLPDCDGRSDSWSASAMEALSAGKGKWIRLRANIELGGYEVITGIAPVDASWPGDVDAVFKKALAGRIISTLDHPLVKKLRGLE